MDAFLRIFLAILLLGLTYLFLRRRHRSRRQKPHEKFKLGDDGPDDTIE
jgi:hypothetical protein